MLQITHLLSKKIPVLPKGPQLSNDPTQPSVAENVAAQMQRTNNVVKV